MRLQKHKIKAAVLMVVFSLNTVVGFACSVGLVDFAKNNHKEKAPHSHDKPHSHQKGEHPAAKEEAHEHAAPHHHAAGENEEKCCSDEVVKIQVTDKNVTTANQNLLPPSIELVDTLHAFVLSLYMSNEAYVKPAPPHLRWRYRATIQNLRIVIQSFLI